MTDDDREWATLVEAARLFGKHPASVRRRLDAGDLPSARKDSQGRWLVDVDEVATATGWRRATPPVAPGASTRDSGAVPAGTMLVPREAWEQTLAQLANLHEAGRELAEARERAAKAETEARFLRERLTELRAHEAPPAPAPGRSWWPAVAAAVAGLVVVLGIVAAVLLLTA